MPDANDLELLAEYARNESQTAFAAIVSRHANLVYSAALRFTSNPHHAQEITQAVFIVLARKGASLRPSTVLSGWLYQTARLTAANFLRGEVRRQRREQEAYMQSTLNEPGTAVWEKVTPLLDEAMGLLRETDRNAVVLRFFENKTNREVATALNLTEAAAHQRVSRALEKLRKVLTKRGLTLTASALAGAVSANSVQAAPAELMAALANGAATTGSIAEVASETVRMMTWAKIKAGIAVGVSALALTAVIGFALADKSSRAPASHPANVQPPVATSPPERNVTAVAAATNYELVEVEPLPGFNSSHVMALNNRGQLVGSVDSTNHETHAFFWENGVMTDLGTFGGSKSLASDVNDAGDIVGIILTNGERHAFLRHNNEVSDLGIIDHFAKLGEEGDKYRGGPGTIYYAPRVTINGLSEVTGTVMDSEDNPHSFLLDKGRTSYFGQLGDGNVFYAEAINSRKQILGRATQNGGPMRYMLWQNGKMLDLGSLGLAPAAINDRGIMVGWMVPTNSAPNQGQAFIWENGNLRPLKTGARKGHPSAINNLGQVVGDARTPKNRSYACLWNGDELLDLNDLVRMKPGWHLTSASAINDRGQILARMSKGNQNRNCLLSPSSLSPLLEDQVATPPASPEDQAAAIVPFNLTSFERLPSGAFRLGFAGRPDGEYVIEASTNLVAWTVLGPATNDGGKVQFTDEGAPHFTLRFYRAALVQKK